MRAVVTEQHLQKQGPRCKGDQEGRQAISKFLVSMLVLCRHRTDRLRMLRRLWD